MGKQRNRPISPAALGREGEREFPTYCSGLIVNKSSEDLAGWDYIIDLPNEHVGCEDFPDRADDVMSARIQVKSIWDDNSRISAPLKAMQRLTAFNGPAFLIVMKFNHDLEITSLSVKHIFGDFLGKILKRLTKETGNTNLSKLSISFSIDSSWHQVDLKTKSDLKNHLISVLSEFKFGSSYVTEKAKQRQGIGVDENARILKFSINQMPISDIVDAFIGIKPIEINNATISESRFGIERKTVVLPTGTKLVADTDAGGGLFCSVRVSSDQSLSPNAVIGRLLVPPLPHIALEDVRCRFIVGAFSIVFALGEQANFSISMNFNIEQTLKIWKQQVAFLSTLAEPGACFSIAAGQFNNQIRVTQTSDLHKFVLRFSELTNALEHMQIVYERMAIPEIKFSLQEFFDFNVRFSEAYYLMENQKFALRITMQFDGDNKFDGTRRICFVRRLKVKGIDIVYSSAADVICTPDNKQTNFYLKNLIGFDFCPFESYSKSVDHPHWEKMWNLDDVVIDGDTGIID